MLERRRRRRRREEDQESKRGTLRLSFVASPWINQTRGKGFDSPLPIVRVLIHILWICDENWCWGFELGV
jgi:hypothetical protein